MAKAQPTCPKCGGHQFGITRMQLVGRGMVNYDVVHCVDCGAPIHVLDLTVREVLVKIANKLGVSEVAADRTIMPTKRKKSMKVYGPTSRPYGRVAFRSVRAAALWCEKHPDWISITKRANGTVSVKRAF